MSSSGIDAVRELLRSKPRPAGFAERRERLDAIGSISPASGDIRLEPARANGVPAEWSLAPGSDSSCVVLFFHGGGYCSGSIVSHRGMVTEAGRAAGARTLAVGYRLAPEHPFPAAVDDARAAYHFLLDQGIAPSKIAIRWGQRRWRPRAGAYNESARCRTTAPRLRLAGIALG